MFTSDADVFRTRQSIRDLRKTIEETGDNALSRLSGSGLGRGALRRVVTELGCRFDAQAHQDIYSETLLAAAMPDEDFPAFTLATALLLADRLQGGGGTDDLYWNWEAFSDHYRLADPPVRAAIMNGFRTLALAGRVTLGAGPSSADCLTRMVDDVISALRRSGHIDLLRAVTIEVSAEDAGQLWVEHAAVPDGITLKAGFRYLYERPASIRPPDPAKAPLIPWG
jgi:hypothetical protein